MALIDEVKNELRIDGEDYNGEVQGLIDAVKLEMESKGLDKTKIIDTDALVKQCVMLYCKANFGVIEPKISEYLQDRFDKTLHHMLLSGMYRVTS